MSIIYDALKKAEKIINPKPRDTLDTKDKHPKPKYQPYLLYGIVACIGLVIGNAIFGFLSLAKKPPLKQTKTPPQGQVVTIPKPIPAIPSKTASMLPIENKAQESLLLNGVFFSGDEGYALINDRALKEGDTIEGVVVKRIRLDGVELQGENGQITKLSTNTR